MHDLRLAIRSLAATPIVTCVAVLSLALGIGANTAIFSLVDSLVLRPLPVPEPGRLFLVSTATAGSLHREFSYATFAQIRDRVGAFDGALGFTACCGKSIVGVGGGREMVDRQFVTGDFFQTLDVRAHRGRLLAPADDTVAPPDGPVAVVSYRYWQQHLGGRDTVVGTPLAIDGALLTIVGVTPPEFFGVDVGRSFDVIAPFHLAVRLTGTTFDDDTVWLNVMVRTRRGVEIDAATAALRAAQPQIRVAAMPKRFPSARFLPDPFTLDPAATGLSTLRERFERPLVVLFAVVGLVLLIACANIGNLLLARGIARRHELSVRVALGASRWRLARQLLAESFVLASAGVAFGVLLTSSATRALLAELSNPRAPITLDTAVDWRVLAFAGATTVATALLFGTAPALRAAQAAPIEALRAPGKGTVGDRRATLSNSLIVAEVGLALLLVVAAGLFVRTFERLVRVPLGFDPDRTLVVSITASTVPAAERPMFINRLAQAVAAVPGVGAAGAALNPPVVGELGGADLVVSAPGTPPPPDAPRISRVDVITPGWFAAYSIPIDAGRDFDNRDAADAPLVMIVNEAFVRRLFPGRNVIGMPLAMAWRIGLGDLPYGTRTIIGVVGDSVYHAIREPVQPMIFLPLARRDPLLQKDFYLGVRAAAGSPTVLERTVAAAITTFSRDVAFSFEPLAEQIDASLAENRVMALLSALFGGLALLLAALGLYGVTAYAVAQRRGEIGIRMALGAEARAVVRLVLGRMVALVAIGVGTGAAVAWWASTYAASLLFGLAPRDPVTFAGAAAILIAVGLAAAGLPAWRASRIDPAEVLRES